MGYVGNMGIYGLCREYIPYSREHSGAELPGGYPYIRLMSGLRGEPRRM